MSPKWPSTNQFKFVNLAQSLIKLGIFASKNTVFIVLSRTIAAKHGFVICELFTGHGVGRLLHLPPQILHHCKVFVKYFLFR
jgi:methionine aminopeptidase